MIEFQLPRLSDKLWVDQLLAYGDERGCEYNFTNLYAWSAAYDQEVARVDDFFVERLCGPIGCCYLYPSGRGDVRPVIEALRESHCKACGDRFKLICVTPAHIQTLEELYPGQFTFSEDRHGFDYLYEIDRLADLGGKKLHNKRTHINRFEENNPDWAFEVITPENLPECLAMDEEWYRLNRGYEGDESLGDEGVSLRLAIRDYQTLGLEGGLIRVGGRVIAFTIGDRLSSDTYDVHFEKAFGDIQGAYAIINREFARWVRKTHPYIKYLNREDDMGVEGLRKAKESYYPDLMIEKHSAVWNEG